MFVYLLSASSHGPSGVLTRCHVAAVRHTSAPMSEHTHTHIPQTKPNNLEWIDVNEWFNDEFLFCIPGKRLCLRQWSPGARVWLRSRHDWPWHLALLHNAAENTSCFTTAVRFGGLFFLVVRSRKRGLAAEPKEEKRKTLQWLNVKQLSQGLCFLHSMNGIRSKLPVFAWVCHCAGPQLSLLGAFHQMGWYVD